jgi:hypothetical protein
MKMERHKMKVESCSQNKMIAKAEVILSRCVFSFIIGI